MVYRKLCVGVQDAVATTNIGTQPITTLRHQAYRPPLVLRSVQSQVNCHLCGPDYFTQPIDGNGNLWFA